MPQKDNSLSVYTGTRGLASLLTFFDPGPLHDPDYSGPRVADIREFTEVIRRLMLPYYEEARLYWERAIAEGYFGSPCETYMYLPDTLQSLVEKYTNGHRETDT